MTHVRPPSKSFVSLDPAFVSSMLSGFRFDLDQTYEYSLQLAQLAEKFSSVGSDGAVEPRRCRL